MAHTYPATFQVEYQQYDCNDSEKHENGKRILEFNSRQKPMDVDCPMCGSRVMGHRARNIHRWQDKLEQVTNNNRRNRNRDKGEDIHF